MKTNVWKMKHHSESDIPATMRAMKTWSLLPFGGKRKKSPNEIETKSRKHSCAIRGKLQENFLWHDLAMVITFMRPLWLLYELFQKCIETKIFLEILCAKPIQRLGHSCNSGSSENFKFLSIRTFFRVFLSPFFLAGPSSGLPFLGLFPDKVVLPLNHAKVHSSSNLELKLKKKTLALQELQRTKK